MVRAVQAKLGVGVDGRAGPETWGAIYKRIVDRSSPPDVALTEVSDLTNQRSEKVIATLHARVRPYARALYFKAREHGITINIISGTRTYAEQDALYAQGRTRPGNVVTNARGGYSNHNFGIAFDIGHRIMGCLVALVGRQFPGSDILGRNNPVHRYLRL